MINYTDLEINKNIIYTNKFHVNIIIMLVDELIMVIFHPYRILIMQLSFFNKLLTTSTQFRNYLENLQV